jgi:hypothetical protein
MRPSIQPVAIGRAMSRFESSATLGGVTENEGSDDEAQHDWFDRQFEGTGEGPFTLHILTHGRIYKEAYETLDEAIEAARAAWGEPRETPVAITDRTGRTCMDQATLESVLSV